MSDKSTKVRTRFAPSPTGFLHIGSLRTALYSYAFAKSQNGDFILRIEDTDRVRFVKGATEKLIQIMKVFGLKWDEGPAVGGPFAPYIQSERVRSGIYKEHAEKLLSQGNAYYCFCKPKTKEEIKEDHIQKKVELRDSCRNFSETQINQKLSTGVVPAIRLKVPEGEKISYRDFVINKNIEWNSDDVDDVMLLKSDGYPTYHLGVVVDDSQMQITHITRAHEWLPSTPVHLLLYKYFGFDIPKIGHVSDILDPSGGKLSKRKGNVSCEDFISEGYLPEAILNFIMLLGWAPKDNREFYTLTEFVKTFPNGDLQTANPIFNNDKLDWFNGEYIRRMENETLATKINGFYKDKYNLTLIKKITPLIKERIVKLSDFETLAGFFFQAPKGDDTKMFEEGFKIHLGSAVKSLEGIDDWKLDNINNTLMKTIGVNEFKTGKFFMSLRIAITGSKFTPPINESAEIIGKKETISRLKRWLR
jgi:glutamyl-tRNA synthetase